jgi:sulfide dehydrogenase cytochrome subunit
MRVFTILSILLIVGLSLTNSAATSSSDARGAALANACAACHGPHGRSQGAIPAIDNLPAEEFVTALKGFRAGERTGTVMNRIAKGLDDADISAVGRYFAIRQQR